MLRFTWRRTLAWGIIAAVIIGAWLFASSLNPDAKGKSTMTGSASPSAIAPAVLVDTPPVSDGRRLDIGARQGQLAPNFEASDLSNRRFELSDYRGHPTLVNFWASWCTACKQELPAIQAAAKEHEVHGLRVLAVNMGDDPETARHSLASRGITALDVALDLKTTVADAYGVHGLPVSFFLGADGVVRRVRFGEMSPEIVNRYVLEILDQRPAALGASPEPDATPAAASPPATVRLVVDRYGPSTLLLQSPILRCSAGFCSSAFIVPLLDTSGIVEAWWPSDRGSSDQGLGVRYDASAMTPDGIVALYEQALTKSPDPKYPLPHDVEVIPPGAAFGAMATLTVGSFGPNTAFLQSPSLRCGADFCAGGILKALRELWGVKSVNSRVVDGQTGDWGFAVSYDPQIATADEIVVTYEAALRQQPDPEYPLPHRVEIVPVQGR